MLESLSPFSIYLLQFELDWRPTRRQGAPPTTSSNESESSESENPSLRTLDVDALAQKAMECLTSLRYISLQSMYHDDAWAIHVEGEGEEQTRTLTWLTSEFTSYIDIPDDESE